MMNKLYNNNNSRFIVYNQIKSNQKSNIDIIFLHGLMSDMQGAKALHVENYCINKGYGFIRFDNFGHGDSSGNFIDETIGSWLDGLSLILDKLVLKQAILVGSSMGGWLALLANMRFRHKIFGTICLSAAPDFTEDLIWKKLSSAQQTQMKIKGSLDIGDESCSWQYPISYQLITEARKHLILVKTTIPITSPLHLIHGVLDSDVPYETSIEIMRKAEGSKVILKLIKDGEHRLSRQSDLEIIEHSIDEIISQS